METKTDTFIIVDSYTKEDPIPENCIKKAPKYAGEKKKRGAVQLLKAASFILRRPKKPKPFHVEVASKGISKRLLHDHSNQSSPPPSIEAARPLMLSTPMVKHLEDVSSPMSRSGESSSSCSEASTSRYASAVNLQELDRSQDIDDGEAYANCGGDEMIDAKAEEFIAQFYEQMRLQRMNSFDRRYHDMIQRSIG